ncbi:hypothetical protein ABW636_12235 [Aquimarina sp. 2201CG1-2-11]|uniref:hypothetical protein n=1 Tax=Aquimarina discodermiae TaxID=3231043 RepID=UPI00346310F2
MIYLKRLGAALSVVALFAIFTQCASAQNKEGNLPKEQVMDKEAPITTDNVYYLMRYEGGTKSKGFTVYIPVDKKPDVELEYIYFKGKKVALQYDDKNTMYVAEHVFSDKPDLIMSDDPKEEFKNQLPAVKEKIPFEIKENEGVVGYTKSGKKGHFKIVDIPNKTR